MATGNTHNLLNLASVSGDETAAHEMFARLRWPNGVACPRCGGADPYKLTPKAAGKNPARKGLYKCKACRKQFSTTTGTIFEASHVPLSKWLMAVHLLAASKKGMSAHQLHRMLNVTYRAAWFMAHRLRHAMSVDAGIFVKLDGIVEVDERSSGRVVVGSVIVNTSRRRPWSDSCSAVVAFAPSRLSASPSTL